MNVLIGFGATLLAPKFMTRLTNQKVQVVHAGIGRVRLQCDKWKNKPTAKNLEAALSGLPIIREVEASPITA